MTWARKTRDASRPGEEDEMLWPQLNAVPIYVNDVMTFYGDNLVSTPPTSMINPYLFFNGRCDEAIEFYRRSLDAQVKTFMRFKDNPDPPKAGCNMPPGWENKIMHAELRIGENTVYVSDGGGCTEKHDIQGFGLSLAVHTSAEADKFFKALADGGKVVVPQSKTFFSTRFGMVTDRFGVLWIILVV